MEILDPDFEKERLLAHCYSCRANENSLWCGTRLMACWLQFITLPRCIYSRWCKRVRRSPGSMRAQQQLNRQGTFSLWASCQRTPEKWTNSAGWFVCLFLIFGFFYKNGMLPANPAELDNQCAFKYSAGFFGSGTDSTLIEHRRLRLLLPSRLSTT